MAIKERNQLAGNDLLKVEHQYFARAHVPKRGR